MKTHLIETTSTLIYDVTEAADFQMQIAVRPSDRQTIQEEQLRVTFQGEPVADAAISADVIPTTDNRCHRFHAEPGSWQIFYRAVVQSTPNDPVDMQPIIALSDLPADVLPYLSPSRYCESDRLVPEAMDRFGGLPKDGSLVRAIEETVFQRTNYTIGSSNSLTTAIDTWLQTEGVCRDFSHLLISLCRAMDIPARYASGYLIALEPPDFHAATEVYLGGGWHLIDATRLAPLTGFVTIGIGRDAADAPFATFDGAVILLQNTVAATAHQ